MLSLLESNLLTFIRVKIKRFPTTKYSTLWNLFSVNRCGVAKNWEQNERLSINWGMTGSHSNCYYEILCSQWKMNTPSENSQDVGYLIFIVLSCMHQVLQHLNLTRINTYLLKKIKFNFYQNKKWCSFVYIQL